VTAVRPLVVIGDDLYVRSFVRSGAFRHLGSETAYIASSHLANLAELEQLEGFVQQIDDPPERMDTYGWIRAILMTAYRARSRTMRIKVSQIEPRMRRRLKLYALPGIRQHLLRRNLRRLGPNRQLEAVIARLEPDILISPTNGADALTLDSLAAARRAGIPSLALINGWDNLASKATFVTPPDFIGVWGRQSVEHAERIHRIPPHRALAVGVPTFEGHFSFDADATPSPYPFPYALFAGSALPFDELSALRILDQTLSETDGPLKIVYRPHPWRQPRSGPDRFVEGEFDRVVLDEQVRDVYASASDRRSTIEPREFLPELAYYPSLIGHARLVVTPLSTMLVEAAILNRPVLAIAYDDGVHEVPPSKVFEFDHFDGIEAVVGIELCRSRDALGPLFAQMLGAGTPHGMREQIKPFLYFDERPYAERLAALVKEIVAGSATSSAQPRSSLAA
jgi:hypothetical protein